MEVIESGYSIENLVFSAKVPRDETWESLAGLAEEASCHILYMNSEDSLVMGQETMTCLYPAASREENTGDVFATESTGSVSATESTGSVSASESTDRNALSMVLLWKSGDFLGLFTGDISKTEEKQILKQWEIGEIDFYKAAHHGSNNSNSSEFLDHLSPKIAVISCGEDNSYGHPGAEAVLHMEEAGCEIFYTMERGQVTIEMKKDKVEIWQYIREDE